MGAGLMVAALAHAEAEPDRAKIRQGGTFRITYSEVGPIDPALGYHPVSWPLLTATCIQLMNYPDKPSPAGLRLVPEAAAAYPTVSRDGKTYTFTIRSDLRFSDGARLTAESFARAFIRALARSMNSEGAFYLEEVVGAKNAREGTLPAGIVVLGNKLRIRLTKPVPDFPFRMALPFFCAVPPSLPTEPEGVGAPLPSAGPYYVAEYVHGRRIVLRRNTFYSGPRPHHVAGFVADGEATGPLDSLERVKANRADWTPFFDRAQFGQSDELARLYGLNRSRFFIRPGLYIVGFYLNTTGPLFRNNAQLRRAVNFAVDRTAILNEVGSLVGGVTDQYLPPSVPGFRDARIYPLRRPDVRKAKALARGRLRSGKAVLYISDDPILLPQAQIVRKNLAAIGLRVEIKVAPTRLHFSRLFTPGEPWDIGSFGWSPEWPDPSQYLNALFAADSGSNPAFRSAHYSRLLARAARLRGDARYRTYGALDIELARDAAPYVAIHYANEPTLVSKRVGCLVLRPNLDLAAVCLK